MPFPETERIIYKSNPLIEVICQLKFPSILRIDSGDLADFQDRIRTNYPFFEAEETKISMPGIPNELKGFLDKMLPNPLGPQTYKFKTKDTKRYISISRDFLALSETNYTEWELFKKEIVLAEAALREVYKPAFYTRIGLRYKNLVIPSALGFKEFELGALIQPQIISELGSTAVSKEIKQIMTRCVIDLMDIPMGRVTLNHGLYKKTEPPVMGYLIDADFSLENKEVLDEAFEILDRFHTIAGHLFRWCITDKLHNAMEPKPI